MPLPADFTTVGVYGTYVDLDGNPAQGTIKFYPSTRLHSAVHDTAVLPTVFKVTLDANGQFLVALPGTDDPDIEPEGWVYRIVEELGGYSRSFNTLIPLGGGFDLTGATPIIPVREYLTLQASDIHFTPTGTISSTNVQSAVAEVASEAGGGGGGAVASVNGQTGAVVLDRQELRAPTPFSNVGDGGDLTPYLFGFFLDSIAHDGGHLVIPPGTWTWPSAGVSWDAQNGPIVIDARGATLNYAGTTNPMLTIMSSVGSNVGDCIVRGGNWVGNASAPGCIRIQDVQGTQIEDVSFIGFNIGWGIELRNEIHWTENTKVTNCSANCRTSILFTPGSVAPGVGGTESFARTRVERFWSGGGGSGQPKFHLRGSVYGSSFSNCGGNVPGGCDVYRFDGGRYDGTDFPGSHHYESAGNNAALFRHVNGFNALGGHEPYPTRTGNYKTQGGGGTFTIQHTTEPMQFADTGATATRPVLANVAFAGREYFDTSQNRPVWWNGTTYVAARSRFQSITTPVTVASTTAKTTLATFSIPAGAAVGDVFTGRCALRRLNNTGAAVNFTHHVDVAGIATMSTGALSIAANANNGLSQLEWNLTITGATTAIIEAMLYQGTASTQTMQAIATGQCSMGNVSATIAGGTANTFTVVVAVTIGTSSANAALTLVAASAWYD